MDFYDTWESQLRKFEGKGLDSIEDNSDHSTRVYSRHGINFTLSKQENEFISGFFTDGEFLCSHTIVFLNAKEEAHEFFFKFYDRRMVIRCTYDTTFKMFYMTPTYFTETDNGVKAFNISKALQFPELNVKTQETMQKLVEAIKNHPSYRLQFLLDEQVTITFRKENG